MDVQNITILNLVVLSVLTIETSFLDSSLGTVFNEIIVSHDIARHETSLKVCVDGTCSLWSLCTTLDSPTANLIVTSSEEIDKLKSSIASTDNLGKSATSLKMDFVSFASGLLCLLLTSSDELSLKTGTEGDDGLRPWLGLVLDPLNNLGKPLVALTLKVVSRHVDKIDDRLGAEEIEVVDSIYLIGLPFDETDGTTTLDSFKTLVEDL